MRLTLSTVTSEVYRLSWSISLLSCSLSLVFDAFTIPSLIARSHWFSLTVVDFKHFEWASRSELNPKPYIGSYSLAVLCRKLPISRLIRRRSFWFFSRGTLLQWERIELSTFNGIIMRRFGKTLGEGARRFCCVDIHALVISWTAFSGLPFWTALGGDEESSSDTSSEDCLWVLACVHMLVQRAFWRSGQQRWFSTWI